MLSFRQWLEDAGLTHDDYVNKGPYIAKGVRSKYRTKEDPVEESPENMEAKAAKQQQCRLKRFGNIDRTLMGKIG